MLSLCYLAQQKQREMIDTEYLAPFIMKTVKCVYDVG